MKQRITKIYKKLATLTPKLTIDNIIKLYYNIHMNNKNISLPNLGLHKETVKGTPVEPTTYNSRRSRLAKRETKASINWKMQFYKFLAIGFGATTFLFVGLFFTAKFFDTYHMDFRTPIIVQAPIVLVPRVKVASAHAIKKPETSVKIEGLVSPIPDDQVVKKKN